MKGLTTLICGALLLTTSATGGLFSTECSENFYVAAGKKLEGVKRIAVMDITGEYGANATDELIGSLVRKYNFYKELEYDETANPSIYEAIERSRMQELIKEQSLSLSGIIDENSAVRMGGILGVDAVIIGSVNTTTKDHYVDKEETYYENKVKYTRMVRYYIREVSGSIDVRVIMAKSGQIAFTSSGGHSVRDEKKNYGELMTGSVMRDQVISYSANSIIGDLYPRTATCIVELVSGKEYKVFNENMKKGNYDVARALASIEENKNQYSAEWAYNSGIAKLLFGKPELAKSHLAKAVQLKPDKKEFSSALKEAEIFENAEQELRKTGYIFKGKSFDDNVLNELMERADKKFGEIKSKDTKGFAEANEGSSVLIVLPKGIKVEVEGEYGDFFKIKLIDGKEVYVMEKAIKM